MSERNPTKSSWTIRRRVMFTSLAFAKAVIAYCLWRNLDSAVAEQAVVMSYGLIISIIGFYVGGATWEDVKKGRP